MYLHNRRKDVRYFQVEVTDKDFNPVPFAPEKAVYDIYYLNRQKIEVYVRDVDLPRITYICSKSAFLATETTNLVVSRICSKLLH